MGMVVYNNLAALNANTLINKNIKDKNGAARCTPTGEKISSAKPDRNDKAHKSAGDRGE